MRTSTTLRRCHLILASMVLTAAVSTGVRLEGGDDDAGPLDVWGAVKHLHDDYFDLRFKEGRKSHAVFVRLGDKADYLRDRLLTVTELAEGDSVWILGRRLEQDVPGQRNVRGGTDRQMQNVQAILRGIESEPKRKPRDAEKTKVAWYRGKVVSATGSLSVEVNGDTYRAVMRKSTPIVAREKIERDEIKKTAVISVMAKPTEQRPETKRKSDREKKAYDATKVIVLDPRLLRSIYPLILD